MPERRPVLWDELKFWVKIGEPHYGSVVEASAWVELSYDGNQSLNGSSLCTSV